MRGGSKWRFDGFCLVSKKLLHFNKMSACLVDGPLASAITPWRNHWVILLFGSGCRQKMDTWTRRVCHIKIHLFISSASTKPSPMVSANHLCPHRIPGYSHHVNISKVKWVFVGVSKLCWEHLRTKSMILQKLPQNRSFEKSSCQRTNLRSSAFKHDSISFTS